MRIVISSPHAFGASSQVGAHHLARVLARRGHRVLFLSHPVTPLHGLARGKSAPAAERWGELSHGAPAEMETGLFHLLPMTLFPLAGRWGLKCPAVLDHWTAGVFPPLNQRLRAAGFTEPDALILDGPIGLPLQAQLRPTATVLRILDRLEGFRGTTPAVLNQLKRAAGKADAVIATTAGLSDYAKSLGASAPIVLPNGVDFAAFQTPDPPLPEEYLTIPAPRVVYVGAMDDWFDCALVRAAARLAPTLNFILIGPTHRVEQSLGGLDNVHLLGPKPWRSLPGYLRHAQCGFIPFDIAGFPTLVNDINPLKLFEYLASGLPTVTVRWDALNELNPPVTYAGDAAEMTRAIRQIIADPPAADHLRAYAAGYDWAEIGARLDDILTGTIHRTAAP